MSTIPAIRAVEFRLRAYRNDAPTDLTGFLTRARVSLGDVSTVGTGAAGGDGLSMTADITLINDRPGHDPLQPGADSSFNRPNPLLSPNRRIMLDVRATPEGQAFGRWVTIFDGLLNATRLQNNGSRVQVRAQDWAKVLQRTMIPGNTTYGAAGGQRLDLVVQQLITDNVPNAPVIHVVGTPSFFVEPYQPAFGSVWDAIQQLVTQAGWYFGMRRGIGGAFALTLMDPPRDKTTPDWLFTGDDVITADVDRDDIDVRNAFLVRYVDGVTREPTQYPLAGPYVNQQSVDAIGGVQQLMIIELGDTSQIDTAAEAQALLERADHDLSSMLDATQVELPIMPELNLFDTVSVNVPSVGSPQLFAVNSLEHTIDIPARGGTARYRTTISGSSKVAGKYRNWLDLEVRPGSPNDTPGPHQTRLLAPRVTLLPGQPGFIVAVEAGPASRGVGAVGVEVHWSTTNGFNPGPGTLKASGPEERFEFANLTSNAPHYVRVRAFDEHGRYGPYSAQQSVTPSRIDSGWLLIDQDTAFGGNVRVLGDGNTGTLEFWDGPTSNPANRKLVVGAIPTGFGGAPANQIGVAGEEGSWWFRGAPKIIDAGSYSWADHPVVPADTSALIAFPTTVVRAGPFTVPAGKKWLLLSQAAASRSAYPAIGEPAPRMYTIVGGGVAGPVLVAGTYANDLLLQVHWQVYTAAGPLNQPVAFDALWQIIEIDA